MLSPVTSTTLQLTDGTHTLVQHDNVLKVVLEFLTGIPARIVDCPGAVALRCNAAAALKLTLRCEHAFLQPCKLTCLGFYDVGVY
jgi:hypothetical protein